MPFAKKLQLRSPEILEEIFKLRNNQMGFPNIAKSISEKFAVNITHPTAEKLYYEYVTKRKIKAEHGEDIDKWDIMIKSKFERVSNLMSTLVEAAESLQGKLTVEDYLKYAPTIIAISQQVLNQLMFLQKEQEQITLSIRKTSYTPLQIIQEFNKLEEAKKKEKEYIIK